MMAVLTPATRKISTATWGIYQRIVVAYRRPDRGAGKAALAAVITAPRFSAAPALTELFTLGRTRRRRAGDVVTYFDRPGTSNGPTGAINGRLEHLRGTALGFRNPHQLPPQITAGHRRLLTVATPSAAMSRISLSGMLPPATRLTSPSDPTAFVATDREIQFLQLKRRALTPLRQLLVSRRRPAGRLGPAGPSEYPFRRPHSEYTGPTAHLEVEISEFSYYRDVLHVEGWAKSEDHLVGLGFVPRAGDAVRVVDLADPSSDEAESFQFDIYEPDREAAVNTTLMAEFASGELVAIQEVAGRALDDDPVNVLNRRFQDEVRKLRAPEVLEVGSRARSGNLYRSWLPAGATYVGLDILPGENVDVVGDVHCLSSSFLPAEGFDAIFSVSTMEHLAMPWVAAAEMNRVIRPGGLVFIASNQTWPVHDAPWDFYRFSEDSWATLFNKYSGFEIVGTAAGEPAKVVANIMHAATNGLELQPAFLSSAVLARKVSSTDLVWAAQASEVVSADYPI